VKQQRAPITCEHGTPPAGVELARYALGGIDLDPSSNAYWNRYTVKADAYYDRRQDGLRQPWGGKLFVNPPGADDEAESESLVRPFWDRLVALWRAGTVHSAVFWGFSVEQLQTLQSSETGMHPARCITLLFAERQKHMVRAKYGGPPTVGEAPMHGTFCSLLPNRAFRSTAEQQRDRFIAMGAKLGQVVRPW
jgi:hypothetical protein